MSPPTSIFAGRLVTVKSVRSGRVVPGCWRSFALRQSLVDFCRVDVLAQIQFDTGSKPVPSADKLQPQLGDFGVPFRQLFVPLDKMRLDFGDLGREPREPVDLGHHSLDKSLRFLHDGGTFR